MACVVSALKAHHALGAFGEPVDQFAFTFVTPLGANDDDVASFSHVHADLSISKSLYHPLPCRLNKHAVAMEFINFTFVTWQDANHGFTLRAQTGNGGT